MRVPVFDPRKVPFRGLYSYPIGSSLEPGQFQELVGFRMDDGSLRVRPGQYEEQSDARTTGSVYIPDIVAGGSINEGTFYGGILARLNQAGDYAAIAAVEVSAGNIGFFYAYYNGTEWSGWGRYTAATVETGGVSVMSTPTFGYMSITPVPNGSGGIVGFIAQSGTQVPQFLANPLSSSFMWTINDVAFPKQASSFAPVATANGFIDIATGAMVASWPTSGTHYTSDGTFDPSTATSDEGNIEVSGSSPNQTWLLTSGGSSGTSTPTVGDFGWFRCHADDDGDFTGAKQVWVICDPSDYAWFTCCKWYLTGTTAGDLLIHDPSDYKDSRTMIGLDGDKLLVAFSLADHAGKDLTDINGIKIEVSNARLSNAATLRIYGVIGSGAAPGLRTYAGSLYNQSTYSESPAVNYDPVAKTEACMNLGCALDGDVKIPWDPRLFYSYDVPIFAPTETEAQKGVYTYRVYAQDAGEGDLDPEAYYHVQDVTVALYDSDDSNGPGVGAGAETVYATFANDEAAWSEKAVSGTFVDSTEKADKDFQNRKPSAYNQSTPRGTHQIFANGRMYVCGVRGTGSSLRNNAVLVSEKDQPMRFAYVSPKTDGSIDLDGPTMHSLEDENGVRLIAVATSLIGVPTIYCFTDRSLYSIEPYAPVKIADHGTVAPFSVASGGGALYWVDQDLVLMQSYQGSLRQLSRYKVHDILTAVPAARRKFMSGCFHKGRFYLGHADASSNENWRVLVYNPAIDEFESDDKVPTTVPCSLFFNWIYGSEGRLMFFTKNGQLWEYEREGTADDNGTDIPIAATSFRFHENGERVRVRQACIIAKDQDSKTLTVTRTGTKPAATKAGTMSLNAGGSETSLWRVDKTNDSAAQEPMLSACGVDVALTSNVDHPWYLEAWYQDVDYAGRGQDSGQ